MGAIAHEAKRLAGKSRLARAKDAVSIFRGNPPSAPPRRQSRAAFPTSKDAIGRSGANDGLMMAAPGKGKDMSPSDEEGTLDDLAQLEALESEDPDASKE